MRQNDVSAPPVSLTLDTYRDTWVATDALGRVLPLGGTTDCPAPRTDRFVGIFYFVWHGHHGTPGPYDISRLTAEDLAHPKWGPKGAFHWWGEPEVGYYRDLDPWVVQHQISLLADAAVDTLLVDVTNAFTYPDEVTLLLDTMAQMRAQGNPTPQVAFVTHSHPAATIGRLWNEVYKSQRHPELWFRWQGKPLLLADENAKSDDGTPLPDEIRAFFTFRYSWAWEPGAGKWPWIERNPQRPGLDPAHPDGPPEELAVSVASHPINGIGRSFHNGKEPALNEHKIATTWQEGIQFQEQWDRVKTIDPQFVFLTGWNEWVAQRFETAPKQKIGWLGEEVLPEGATFFVDQYNAEFSRDIEPMKGGATDNYYYQMVAGIRRFKGARPVPLASAPKTIRPGGDAKQWETVGPTYYDTQGDVTHRDAPGWGDLHYRDTSGRNDIVRSKIARDAKTVFFFVETADKLTPRTDPDWMTLLLDTDQNARTGWQGYDFRIHSGGAKANEAILEKWDASTKKWSRVGAVPCHANGNRLEIAVPRRLLGLGEDASMPLSFDFHWCDNARTDERADPQTDFLTRGDHAPNRRFNYRYATNPPK